MLSTASYPNVGEAAAIAKKRLLEEQRKERVFDAKARTIGVDKLGLDLQVQERQRLRELEQAREAFYDTQSVLMDQHAVYLQQQSEGLRRKDAQDVEQYRAQFQSKHAAREWDLNDPKRVVGDLPVRIGDGDPRCGVSSLQQFHGEDLGGPDRRRQQQAQQRQWAAQQVEERQMRQLLDAQHDQQLGDRFEEINHRAWQAETAAQAQRRAMNQATAEFNQRLAEQKRREQLGAKRKETMDNWEEIRNALDSDLLTEDLDSTLNATNPSRFKRYHMKGLLPEHRQAILNEQAAQREELLKRKEREAEEERAWAVAALKTGQVLTAVEQEVARQRANACLQLKEDQQRQAALAAEQRRRLDATYRNEVTEDFFSKFNQNSR